MADGLDGLDGQVALITGGAGGLGREAARWLAAAGAHVIVADVSEASPKKGADSITLDVPAPSRLHSAVLDVTDSAAVRACVGEIDARHGQLDILLTSHG